MLRRRNRVHPVTAVAQQPNRLNGSVVNQPVDRAPDYNLESIKFSGLPADLKKDKVVGKGGFGVVYTTNYPGIVVKQYTTQFKNFKNNKERGIWIQKEKEKDYGVRITGVLHDDVRQEHSLLIPLSNALKIIKLRDTGILNGRPSMPLDSAVIMKQCNGMDLYDWITNMDNTGDGDVSTINMMVLNVAKSMHKFISHMHDRGFTHLDLKPDNVMICDNTVKVIDFGLSVNKTDVTKTQLCGTPYFLPMYIRKEDFFTCHSIPDGEIKNYLKNVYNRLIYRSRDTKNGYSIMGFTYYDMKRATYQDRFGIAMTILKTFLCHTREYVETHAATLIKLIEPILDIDKTRTDIDTHLDRFMIITGKGDLVMKMWDNVGSTHLPNDTPNPYLIPWNHNGNDNGNQQYVNPLYHEGGGRTRSGVVRSKASPRHGSTWIKTGRKVVIAHKGTRNVYVNSKTGEERVRQKTNDALKFVKFVEPAEEKKKTKSSQKKSSAEVKSR